MESIGDNLTKAHHCHVKEGASDFHVTLKEGSTGGDPKGKSRWSLEG